MCLGFLKTPVRLGSSAGTVTYQLWQRTKNCGLLTQVGRWRTVSVGLCDHVRVSRVRGVFMVLRSPGRTRMPKPPYGPPAGMLQGLQLLQKGNVSRVDEELLKANGVAPGNEYKVVG